MNKVMIGGIGAARKRRSYKMGAANRFPGRPEINYKVVWQDPNDKDFKGTEYHKSLEEAKLDLENWIDLGYKAKIVKGDYTNKYWGDRRYQI
jgi:hypothetical protein